MAEYMPKSAEPVEDEGGYMPKSATPEEEEPMSRLHAATLGVAHGGTGGFVDEIGGLAGEILPSGETAQALGSLLPSRKTVQAIADTASAVTGQPWVRDLAMVRDAWGVPESSVKLGAAAMPSEHDTPEQLQAKADLIGGMAEQPTSYELVRNRIRNEAKQAKEQQGGAYMAGDIAGNVGASIVGNIVAPGGGAFLRGAAEGAIQGLGDSEADLLHGDVTGAAAATAVGAGVGGVSSFVGDQTLGRLARKIPGMAQGTSEGLESMAQGRAVKAATGQNRAAIRQMIKKGELGLDTGTVERVGSDLLNEGVVDAGASARDILQRAGERKEAWGKTIDEALGHLDGLGASIDVPALADDMERSLVDPLRKGSFGDRQIAERLSNEIGALRDQGENVSLSALEAFKRRLDRSIKYSSREMPAASEALLRVRTMLNNAIEDKADEVGKAAGASEVSDLFKEAKKVYSSMAIGEDVAENQVTSQASNRLVAPSDYAMGGAAALVKAASGGHPLGAAVQGAAWTLGHKAIRTRGNQVAASALRGLSGNALLRRVAEQTPEYFGKFAGPLTAAIARGAGGNDAPLAATDYLLSQTDPEWRALKDRLAKEANR